MKLFGLLTLAGCLLATATTAQVGIGTTTPNAAAALDITASGKGLLIPRLDSASRVAIAAPVPAGLLVYQTSPRTGFYYYTGAAWVFLPDKARSGDNLGNHSATQTLSLNDNALQLRSSTDMYHVLKFDGNVNGPLLYGYNGGQLSYTRDGGATVVPTLQWGFNYATGNNIVGVDAAATNDATFPDLVFGGIGSGEGIGSRRTAGATQYGLDFYTFSNKRFSIAAGGNVGVGSFSAAPSSTLQVLGTTALGTTATATTATGLAGGATGAGTALGNTAATYLALAPASAANSYYSLPDAASCPGRLYYLHNNSASVAANLQSGGGSLYDGTATGTVTPFVMAATGATKTVTAISDGVNWTIKY